MDITQLNIDKFSSDLSIPVNVYEEFYQFLIKKEAGHSFGVTLLKNRQYIFVSLLDGEDEYPIEHIEFYNNEAEDEVLAELSDVVKKLKINPSKVVELRNAKKAAELYEKGEWKRYGYPGTKIQK
ncbi:hypothetical protein H8S95_15345 [Pontibacter sp. KCTC 32443]|uniref:hypothetical protein n=1 Tax=Pontibacter TaxID=323449 RepID=UPI00164EC4C7|nr:MULTISPECIES: hypothetical protein [Pontibacter]MBC5775452.1 hypothetical protein [Pontibacter sp. KCTC 32443]